MTDLQATFRRKFVKQTPGRVLVVGSKLYPTRPNWRDWHPDGVGVDIQAGDGVDVVLDLECDDPFEAEYGPQAQLGKFDHIECTSVLEHTQRPWVVAENIGLMLARGGSIFLSVPWVWKFHGYPQDLWRFSHLTFPILFPSIQWRAIRYGVKEALTESPRMPKSVDGSLTKMEVLGWGFKDA